MNCCELYCTQDSQGGIRLRARGAEICIANERVISTELRFFSLTFICIYKSGYRGENRGLSDVSHFSDISLFRHNFCRKSETLFVSLFRHLIFPTSHFSDSFSKYKNCLQPRTTRKSAV